ncbi:MAG: tRNA pseudouridine(13) synthase TruD [Candidatus Woesearchaeota archaeon]
MYKLKQLEEDFIVKEKLDLKFTDNGNYSYYLLKKKNISTFECIKKIANFLKINPKYINASGLKDKKAITYQYISIFRGIRKNFSFDTFNLEYLGSGKERINIGVHEGNYFEIVVRNINQLPKRKDYVINYFDCQRFGKYEDNHMIGRMFIKRQFSDVVNLLIQRNEYKIKEYLEKKPNDYIGSLRNLPKKTLKFYISAYQSYLWNECIKKYSKYDLKFNEVFPIIGFGIEEENEIKKDVINNILNKENLTLRDFIIREFPELTSEGGVRNVFSKIVNLKIYDLVDDELNLGKKKVKITFFLNKGDYATNVCKNLFQ